MQVVKRYPKLPVTRYIRPRDIMYNMIYIEYTEVALVVKNHALPFQVRHEMLEHPWVGKIPWRRAQQPTPVILAWKILWTEEPGGLQSMRSHRAGHN